MPHPHEELIRRGYAAFSQGDLATLREVFDPDIVWHSPGRNQLAGHHRGVEAVLGFFGRTVELSGGTFRIEVHDVVGNDEHVVGLNSVAAERDGRTLRDQNTLVFHVRDGRATEVWQFWADQYAADDFFG